MDDVPYNDITDEEEYEESGLTQEELEDLAHAIINSVEDMEENKDDV